MNPAQPTNNADDRRTARRQASEWQVRLHNGEVLEDDPAYREWLEASPENAAAMDRARSIWASMGENAVAPEILKVRRDAIDRSRGTITRRWLTAQGRPFKVAMRAAAALAVVAAISLPVLFVGVRNDPNLRAASDPEAVVASETYETGIAETRIVTLTDNSRVTLDAATQLIVRYTADARDIELLAGQAFFDVAKDRSRPFRVRAGAQRVLATGTEFNVSMIGREVRVTLVEGEVVVTGERPDAEDGPVAPPVKLRQGEQLVVPDAGSPGIKTNADMEKASAWRNGKVILDGDTLAEAVEQMNRYSRIRLSIASDGLEQYRISGVFHAGDTDAFVDAVEAYLPVDARRLSATQIEFYSRH